MKYANIKFNDVSNGMGVCVSLFTQGCPHHCPGCFNQCTWDFAGGIPFTEETMQSILDGLTDLGVHRDFCLLGGEPLCPQNYEISEYVISTIKEKLPDTKIYIWTGYLYEELLAKNNAQLNHILSMTDVLVDGPFIEKLKDISLVMRGSSNQRIINLTNK